MTHVDGGSMRVNVEVTLKEQANNEGIQAYLRLTVANAMLVPPRVMMERDNSMMPGTILYNNDYQHY